MVAERAPRSEWATLFHSCSKEALLVELEFHRVRQGPVVGRGDRVKGTVAWSRALAASIPRGIVQCSSWGCSSCSDWLLRGCMDS